MDNETSDAAAQFVHVPKGVLSAARICPDDPDVRPEFRVARLSRTIDGEMSVEATDGRRAIRVEWQDAYMLPRVAHVGNIPADIALKADKEIPKKGEPDTLYATVTAGPNLEIRATNGETNVVITGNAVQIEKFPDIHAVETSAADGPQTVTDLGVGLLIGLLQAMQAAGADRVRVCVPHNRARPITLLSRTEDSRTITALQMPLRDSVETPADDDKATGAGASDFDLLIQDTASSVKIGDAADPVPPPAAKAEPKEHTRVNLLTIAGFNDAAWAIAADHNHDEAWVARRVAGFLSSLKVSVTDDRLWKTIRTGIKRDWLAALDQGRVDEDGLVQAPATTAA
jgi:hypothetical protein